MKILVACEESQAVTNEFRRLGHEAYSCDIEPCSGGHPEWHLQQDVLPLLKQEWDMIIAFPPCTHLSVAGAAHWKIKQTDGRQQQGIDFFMAFAEAPCEKIAIENPPGIMTRVHRKPDQYIQPYEFGHPYKKKTGIWLKGLPCLCPTNIVEPTAYWSQPHGAAYKNKSMLLNSCGGHRASKIRSKTFPGIAKAMAEQWGGLNG